jgi:hypothetical protein
MAANINVTRFEPSFNGKLTVEHKENMIVYRSPVFSLTASVEVSIDNAEQYEIGFIQVCSYNEQRNYYGSDATQRWEFAVLPVNDSDDDKNIPWYNIAYARTEVFGPAVQFVARSVVLNDGFEPRVSVTEAGAPTSYLYRIVRNQNFKIWLVAHRAGSTNYMPLRYLEWMIPVDIQFNWEANKPVYSSWVDKSPWSGCHLYNALPPIPDEAFKTPRANIAQALYLYPGDGSPKRFLPT